MIDGGTRVTIGPPRGASQWFKLFVVTFAFGPISLSPSVALTVELISGHEHFQPALFVLCSRQFVRTLAFQPFSGG